jgi:hypothetical protein
MLIGRNATLFGRMVAVQEMCFAGPASFQRIQARSSAWAILAAGHADGPVP